MALFQFVLLMTAVSAGLADTPARAGDCNWVHGRFAIYNGSSVRRIWIIGTKRIIALTDDDESIPPEIERYQRNATKHGGVEDALFGNFYVCALERNRPGWMQHVRLPRVRNLTYRGQPFRAR